MSYPRRSSSPGSTRSRPLVFSAYGRAAFSRIEALVSRGAPGQHRRLRGQHGMDQMAGIRNKAEGWPSPTPCRRHLDLGERLRLVVGISAQASKIEIAKTPNHQPRGRPIFAVVILAFRRHGESRRVAHIGEVWPAGEMGCHVLQDGRCGRPPGSGRLRVPRQTDGGNFICSGPGKFPADRPSDTIDSAGGAFSCGGAASIGINTALSWPPLRPIPLSRQRTRSRCRRLTCS